MPHHLFICSKLDSVTNHSTVTLEFDVDQTVDTLCDSVAKQLNVDQDKFDLMCFGRILSADKTISSYDIRNGCTIYVLRKVQDESADPHPTVRVKPSHGEIQAMVVALRTALMNPSFRNILDKLNDHDTRENLMAVTPGLREDPVTIAILQDPDLLSILTDPNNIHKVLERHPCLSEAATNLAAAFHEENISGSSNPLVRTGPTSYSLDALSDDDDADAVPSGSSTPSESTPANAAAAQQFANFLIRAFQNQHPNAAQNQPSATGVITREMLTQALQQSSSQQSFPNLMTPQPSTSTSASTTSSTRNWSAQLQQMRDLGITDEAAAIQALEAANGDVQVAINLIFAEFNN